MLDNYKLLAALVFVFIFSTNVYAETANSHYALKDVLHLPGATHWDYLAFDSKQHRLFITRGDSVDIFDTVMKRIVGSIPASGAHGVVLAAELGKGFFSNGKANTITVFDLATLKPTLTVSTGTKPDALVYDHENQRLFVANAGSSNMTVINVKDGTVIDTIQLGGQPEFAVVDGKGKLYVNLEDKSQIAIVDTNKLKKVANYDLKPGCDGPTGLALDKAHNHLFSTCANKNMLVVDAGSGKILDTLSIGEHSDAAAFDAKADLAFSSNGDGTLTVVGAGDDGHYKVIQTVQTKPSARTMVINPTTRSIYLVAAETEGFDPPTAQHPEPRPHIKPDTFMILTVGMSP